MISLIEEAGTKAGIVVAGMVHPKSIDCEKANFSQNSTFQSSTFAISTFARKMISLIEETGTKASIVVAGMVHPKPIDREKVNSSQSATFEISTFARNVDATPR